MKIQVRHSLHEKEFAPWKLLVYNSSLVSTQGKTVLDFQICHVKFENNKKEKEKVCDAKYNWYLTLLSLSILIITEQEPLPCLHALATFWNENKKEQGRFFPGYFKHLFPSDFLVSLIGTVFNMSFIYSDKGIIVSPWRKKNNNSKSRAHMLQRIQSYSSWGKKPYLL